MKTEEDEAFDDIERRQGGGFPAKRAMAADKLQEPVMEREALKLAKDVLLRLINLTNHDDSIYEAVDKCEAALAQPAQEPVAFICQGNLYMAEDVDEYCTATHIPLYTAPPKRPWVGLTDEDIKEIHNLSFGKDIGIATGLTEAKIKDKNT